MAHDGGYIRDFIDKLYALIMGKARLERVDLFNAAKQDNGTMLSARPIIIYRAAII